MTEAIREVPLPYLERPALVAAFDNGHMAVVIPKPGEVVHLHTVVRTGSIHEDDTNTGVSHFLEHLMFKGTPTHPAGEFDRMLEGMGARINAATSKDWTQYFVTIPMGRGGQFYQAALDLHADMMLHPALPDEEIGLPFDLNDPGEPAQKRERHVVLEEIRMGKDNPWRRCLHAMDELLYKEHPYRREVIGTPEVIAGVTRETILGYYHRWYAPDNMVTIAAGDLDPERAIREIHERFVFDGKRAGVLPQHPPEAEQTAPQTAELHGPVQTAYLFAAFRGPAAGYLREAVALDVALVALGEGKSSRLNQRLMEKLPDTPFFDLAAAQMELRDGNTLMAYAVCRPDAAQQGAELLKEQIALLSTEPLSDAEFEKARVRMEARFAAEAEVAAGLCGSVADSIARLGNLDAYTEYLPTLRSLTVADVTATVQRFLDMSRLCLVTMTPGGE